MTVTELGFPAAQSRLTGITVNLTAMTVSFSSRRTVPTHCCTSRSICYIVTHCYAWLISTTGVHSYNFAGVHWYVSQLHKYNNGLVELDK